MFQRMYVVVCAVLLIGALMVSCSDHGPGPLPPPVPAPSLLSVPDNLVAKPVRDWGIDLTWRDNSSDEDKFGIERAPGGTEDFVEVGEVDSDQTFYKDFGLTPGTTYRYRVTVMRGEESGCSSETATATTFPPVPVAPSDLFAERTSQTSVRLTWTDNSNNETGFEIQQFFSLSPYSQITRLVAIDTVEAGTTETSSDIGRVGVYTFRVRAMNEGGTSPFSNDADLCPWSVPDAPGDLKASVVPKGIYFNVSLGWNDNSQCESGFRIYRAVYDHASHKYGEWSPLDTEVARDATGAMDKSVVSGAKYNYRVVSLNAFGESGNSNEFEITVTGWPSLP